MDGAPGTRPLGECSASEAGGCGRRRGVLAGAVGTVAVVQGLHLLELVGRKDAGELLLGILLDGMHLPVEVLAIECGVGLQCSDLLVAVGEDGLELGRLVGREAELLREVHGLMVRVGRVTQMRSWHRRIRGKLGLLRLLGVESKGERTREGDGESCGEVGAIHRVSPKAAV